MAMHLHEDEPMVPVPIVSRRLADRVLFARFAQDHRIDPLHLATLMQLAIQAQRRPSDARRKKFALWASRVGFTTEWDDDGTPRLCRNGVRFQLPPF